MTAPAFDLTEEAVEELQSITSSQKEALRERCKRDLYFLCKGILGYKDINVSTHGEFCQFWTEEEKRRRLALMPRGTLKTTIGSIGDGIRQTLADPQDSRILFANEIEGKAKSNISEIKSHFEKNAAIHFLFPELIPDRFTGPGIKWSDEQATLPVDNRIHKDPMWTAVGTGGSITGRHFTCIKPDDLIGFLASHSITTMEEAKKWSRNLQELLVAPYYLIDFIGTRWAVADLYADIMEFYGDQLAVFTRSCIENGEPIFPRNFDGSVRFSLAYYDHLREKEPEQYYAQHENNPITGGRRDLLQRPRDFYFTNEGKVEWIDEPISGKTRSWLMEELDRVMIADPAGDKSNAINTTRRRDLAGIGVYGTSPESQVFSLDSSSARYTPTEFVDTLFDKAMRWRPRVIGIEQVALATTLHYLEKKFRDERVWFNVVPVRPKNRVKNDRILQIVQPLLGTGRLFIPVAQRTLRGQIDFFPSIVEDAEIDCLAYHAEVARPGNRAEDYQEQNVIHERILASRNPTTGY